MLSSSLKTRLKLDDSLDVFAVHGVGGILGTLLVSVLALPSLGGAERRGYGLGEPGRRPGAGQRSGCAWSAGASAILLVCRFTVGLRATRRPSRTA